MALASLADSKELSCGVSFYGINFGLFRATDLSSKPIQTHFGVLDNTFPGFSDYRSGYRLKAELAAVGNERVEVHLYDHVGHSFMNDSPAPFKTFEERAKHWVGHPFDKRQADTAWHRLLIFLKNYLIQKPADRNLGHDHGRDL